MRLSDSFTENGERPALELTIRVININQGKNERIARKCRTLAEYGAFVAKVRELEKKAANLEEAIKRAVIYCRNHKILKEFLEKNATEVLNMLMTEWNMEDALAFRFEEGIGIGMEQGMAQEKNEIARNALAEGASIEFIKKITGLDAEAVKNLRQGL